MFLLKKSKKFDILLTAMEIIPCEKVHVNESFRDLIPVH